MKPEDFDFKSGPTAQPSENGASFLDSLGITAFEPAASQAEEDDSTPVWDEPEHNFYAVDEKTFENSFSFLGSLVFHLVVLLLMVLWPIVVPRGAWRGPEISMEFATVDETEEWEDYMEELGATLETDSSETSVETPEPTETLFPEETTVEIETDPVEITPDEPVEDPANALLEALEQETTKPNDPNLEGEETPTPDGVPQTAQSSGNETNWNQQVMVPRSLPAGGGIGPRTDTAGRGKMLEEAGGNGQSEDAVAMGLAWIARHQQFDSQKKYFGSWSFDLSRYGTPNSGEATSRVAATSLALLALLGHGNTREVGEYKKAVQDGIYFLSTQAHARESMPGYDFRDSPDSRGMYGHILATLALCEAYAMEETKDPTLGALALGGLKWILYAQDQEGGGWRYQPHEAGDVSVTTWVVMLLKSAHMNGFEIPSQTLIKMDLFLDSISKDEKAKYSYQPGRPPIPSTTAMGLCARVFSGAKHDADFLKRGTRYIAEDCGCSESDLYYNYYGSLLLRHYGGPLWRTWNQEMRDYLIRTQEQNGPDRGSWYFDEPEKTNNQIGGRLYTTAMAVMILEVYYRYLPIYKQ
ncbi:MAG: hypothetical protein ACI4UF_09990 [Thermoguttaceae bacterium]